MIFYLIKFTGCLAIFIVFYKLFLERETMHQIKRYFLLVALVLALGIPLITLTQYVEPVPTEIFLEPSQEFVMATEVAETSQEVNYLPVILWTLYGFGVLIFGVKFILNLFRIINKIKHNPKSKNWPFINVLLEDLITPHTFFNYIFLNKQKFEAQEIPHEVFIHEQTHAKQKHSIDVLFIELLQVVFWFNPLLYFIKKDIKLNHEFLADQAVLKNGIQPSSYQNLLLTFSLHDKQIDMANAINYSSIKKRFKVMKTHTSKRNIWLRSIVILPLIAFSIYGFSERKEVIREVALDQIIPQNTEEHETANPILEISFHPETFLLNGQKTSLNQLKKDFINVTNGLKSDLDIKVKGGIQMSLINQIMDTLKGNLGKINLDEKTYIFESKDDIKPILEVEMNPLKLYLNGKETTLENLENDFNELTKNTKSDVILRSNDLVSKPFIDKVWKLFGKNIGSIITEVGKTSVTKEGINSSQQKATPEEFSEYNKLAKHSNSKLSNELPIIKVKDIKRLEYLYGKMSDDQKKNAESYPDFSNVPGPPVMDTIFTYNRLAKRIISIPENRKNNIDYLNKKYNEMSSDLKSKVNSPSQISTEVNLNKTENANENQSKEYKTGFLDVNGETLFYTIIAGKTTFYNRNGYKVSKNGELLNGNTQVDASEVLPGQYITKVYQNDAVVAVFKENVSETKKTIPQTKSKEMVMLNGKKTKDGGFTITKKELDNFELSIKEGVITDFMMKTPGKPTQSIKGNTLNEEAKSLLNALSRGDTFQLILIKNSNNEVHPPLFVEIK